MKALLLTAFFLLPFTAFGATFSLEVPTVGVGERGTATVYVTPSANETIYTAKAIIALDETVLSASGVQFAASWIPLTQPGYDAVGAGQIIKTAGFPGGVTEKTALLSFSVFKKENSTGVITIESLSELYNADGVNIANGFDTKVFPAVVEQPVVSQNTLQAPEEEVFVAVESPVEESQTDDFSINEALPAAVITIEGGFPVIPFIVFLLILIAGGTVYAIIRFGRNRA